MNYLNIHMLLDRSGSMDRTRDKTIDAFNEYIGSIRADQATHAVVSLTIFDANEAGKPSIDQIWDLKKIHGVDEKDVPKLTKEIFVPRGMTPLNDAIGFTVAKIKASNEAYNTKQVRTAFVILTDGLENASKEFTYSDIKTLLHKIQTEDHWLIIYLGANQDAFAEGVKRGTQSGHTMNYSENSVRHAFMASSRATLDFARTGSYSAADFTEAERKEALGNQEQAQGTRPGGLRGIARDAINNQYKPDPEDPFISAFPVGIVTSAIVAGVIADSTPAAATPDLAPIDTSSSTYSAVSGDGGSSGGGGASSDF